MIHCASFNSRPPRGRKAVGRRIQKSGFECSLDAAQFRSLRTGLLSIIDPEKDQLRFYNLGNNYRNRVSDAHGTVQTTYEDPLIY